MDGFMVLTDFETGGCALVRPKSPRKKPTDADPQLPLQLDTLEWESGIPESHPHDQPEAGARTGTPIFRLPIRKGCNKIGPRVDTAGNPEVDPQRELHDSSPDDPEDGLPIMSLDVSSNDPPSEPSNGPQGEPSNRRRTETSSGPGKGYRVFAITVPRAGLENDPQVIPMDDYQNDPKNSPRGNAGNDEGRADIMPCGANILKHALVTYENLKGWIVNSSKWTIMESWNNYGYAMCVVPFRLRWDSDKNECVVEKCTIQKVACCFQHMLSFWKMVRSVSSHIATMQFKNKPFEYIRLAATGASCALKICLLKMAFFDEVQFKRLMKMQKRSQIIRPEQNGKEAIGLMILHFTTSSLLLARVAILDAFPNGTLMPFDILRSFACFGKQLFFLADYADCIEMESVDQLPITPLEIASGIGGTMLFLSSQIIHYFSIHGIVSSCWSFFRTVASVRQIQGEIEENDDDTRGIENTSNNMANSALAENSSQQQFQQQYTFVEKTAERISILMGPILLCQLSYLAFQVPNWLKMILEENDPFVPIAIITLLVMGISVLLASVASLQVKNMKNRLIKQNHQHMLPNGMKELFIFFYDLMTTSVGIGIPGLFVLNFGFLITYVGFVGTFLILLFETENEMEDDLKNLVGMVKNITNHIHTH